MNYELLIADSGSTKTDWALADERFSTQGLNPFHQDEATIRRVLAEELMPQIRGRRVGAVRFYGSGVRTELEPLMVRLLREVFPDADTIEAHGDLLGAAIALCGSEPGIACILGTGANSCLYDGRQIVMNTPPLGYILGDEGSGAVLGRRLLGALYKGHVDDELRRALWSSENLASVIERVYRRPMANRWLASLSVFVHQHIDNPAINQLVVDNFRDFIHLNITPYDRRDLPLNAVGSIAYYYEPQFREAAESSGYRVGKILRSPIEGLVRSRIEG